MSATPDTDAVPRTEGDRLYGRIADLAFGCLWWGARLCGVPRGELRQRAGLLPENSAPLLWFHGASAGEMSAALSLVGLLRRAGYHFTPGYTATNRAGLALLSRRAEEDGAPGPTALVPWDRPGWVARAFDRWQPRALFLIETELWPALILEAARRGVPVLSVSARIYPRDVARYHLVRRWLAPTLARLTAVLAQNETERARFVELGAEPQRCVVAGNLKDIDFDAVQATDSSWARNLGCGDEPLIVFGSLHRDEIDFVFEALRPLRRRPLRVVVAPRHPSASLALEGAARWHGWSCCRRTAIAEGSRLVVLDTIGELRRAYAAARVAVVGGGFARHGGHNLWEAVGGGAPVFFGPSFFHFEAEARALAAATPRARVASPAELSREIALCLDREEHSQAFAARQRAALPNAGAIAGAYLEALSPWLRGVAA